jgi:choline dehydrogenase-like flavoprotein
MGRDASEGVIDRYGRLFGCDRFYIADGSIIPVNLRVNPSLTITALSEWVMSKCPIKLLSGTADDWGVTKASVEVPGLIECAD